MNPMEGFSNNEQTEGRMKIGPSQPLQILTLFAHKFLYPSLYPDYELTEEQFEKLLNLLERKINEELKKVERDVNLENEEMEEDTRIKAEDQLDFLIDSGELFLEAIEEMRMYLEREDDDEGKENLLAGIELAKKADDRLRKSLEIFEELRETH